MSDTDSLALELGRTGAALLIGHASPQLRLLHILDSFRSLVQALQPSFSEPEWRLLTALHTDMLAEEWADEATLNGPADVDLDAHPLPTDAYSVARLSSFLRRTDQHIRDFGNDWYLADLCSGTDLLAIAQRIDGLDLPTRYACAERFLALQSSERIDLFGPRPSSDELLKAMDGERTP